MLRYNIAFAIHRKTMKRIRDNLHLIIAAVTIAASYAYACYYFNYFATPTGDYISNIREPVIEYMKGNFPGSNYKFLPLYPGLLAIIGSLGLQAHSDPVYITAILFNIILYLPYLIIVLYIYRRFLDNRASLAALAFLGINVYSVYMATNAELEMLLTFLIILSLFLTMRDSRIAYVPAFLTCLTKWDSVFIVPSVMFRDFFIHRKRVPALVFGALASTGVMVWLLLSFINTPGHTHPYVSEIAHRGPNIYRFPADVLFVTSGFSQWMAMHGWFFASLWMKFALVGTAVFAAIITLIGMVWGGILFAKNNLRESAPIFIFFTGFIILHMIYQNSKDRYVMPILWICNMLLVRGMIEGVIPWLKKRADALSSRLRAIITIIILCLAAAGYAVTAIACAGSLTIIHIAFAAITTALFAWIYLFEETARLSLVPAATAILLCGILVNCSILYGVKALDHHGKSRLEFKEVGLWYRDHASPDDRMLISETNVPKYYSGFSDDKFIISYFIRGSSLEEVINELRDLRATYVFVDDFYIPRLRYRDPNAIDRKAWIFREIKDRGEQTGHFKMVRTFPAGSGGKGILYRFIP